MTEIEKKTEDKTKVDKEERARTLENVALGGSAYEIVQRFGEANKEFLVGYSGIDNESGKIYSRSLKNISEYKVNPEYRKQNIKQQAGYAAEIKETSRENAERIIKGDKTRVVRTDDFEARNDRRFGKIGKGKTQDQLYDHAEFDANGNIVDASQMKFIGKDPQEAVEKLISSKKYQKLYDNKVNIEVPSDYYDSMKQDISKKVAQLKKKELALKAREKHEDVQKIQQKIEKYKKLDKRLTKSNVSSKEAIEARLSHRLSTAKDILKTSHRAGVEAAKYGAAIGGGISVTRNIVAIIKGEKEPQDAVADVAFDTGTAALASYSTGAAGAVVKSFMGNASSELARDLSKTNLPATIVVATLEAGKTFKKFFNGEIDGVQCLEELGEKGVGMSSSAMFAVLGQMAIPIPLVGAMTGSMIGYALSSACYKELLGALKEAKFAHEERLRIEHNCEEAIEAIREYRAEMEGVISNYLKEHITSFHAAFDNIKIALEIGDVDGFIAGSNDITRKLGGSVQYNTMSEFDVLMESAEPLKL
jgi:hypothetical protein